MTHQETYTNPVYDGSFADPYVLRCADAYYAYGTGSVVNGLAFEVLRSQDLVNWTSVGGALATSYDHRGGNPPHGSPGNGGLATVRGTAARLRLGLRLVHARRSLRSQARRSLLLFLLRRFVARRDLWRVLRGGGL